MKFSKKWKVVPYDENMESNKEKELNICSEKKRESILNNDKLTKVEKLNQYSNEIEKYKKKTNNQTSKNKKEDLSIEKQITDEVVENPVNKKEEKLSRKNEKKELELKKKIDELTNKNNAEIAKIYNQLDSLFERAGLQNKFESSFQRPVSRSTRANKRRIIDTDNDFTLFPSIVKNRQKSRINKNTNDDDEAMNISHNVDIIKPSLEWSSDYNPINSKNQNDDVDDLSAIFEKTFLN